MLYRFYTFIPLSVLPTLALLGALTATISRVSALGEKDFKKVVALSTLRQLGYIIFRLGCCLPILTLFHLLCHALFKALLFLCVGVYIHVAAGGQDIRLVGSLPTPLTSSIAILATLSLCGLPFLSGFYSKDIIIEALIARDFNPLTLTLMCGGASLTLAYSLRLLSLSIFKESGSPTTHPSTERDNPRITRPLCALGLLSVIGGRLLR